MAARDQALLGGTLPHAFVTLIPPVPTDNALPPPGDLPNLFPQSVSADHDSGHRGLPEGNCSQQGPHGELDPCGLPHRANISQQSPSYAAPLTRRTSSAPSCRMPKTGTRQHITPTKVIYIT